jgi:teichuronic acid biosynthesis glycosyltransferase TuaH
MEALADSPAVTWLGARPFAELPTLMSRVDVGITPYVTSTFNVASQPLKTWEYLEAGLPVVSSDLPSARRLLSPDVLVAAGSADFVSAVMRAAALGNDPESVARRRALSRTNDWSARASTLLKILEDVSAHRRGLLDR